MLINHLILLVFCLPPSPALAQGQLRTRGARAPPLRASSRSDYLEPSEGLARRLTDWTLCIFGQATLDHVRQQAGVWAKALLKRHGV
jgi:hypothetical protein